VGCRLKIFGGINDPLQVDLAATVKLVSRLFEEKKSAVAEERGGGM